MKDKRNRHGAVGKSSSKQNLRKSASITCEISGALHLAQLGLTVDGLAGRLAVRRNTGKFRKFQIGCRLKYSSFRFVKPI